MNKSNDNAVYLYWKPYLVSSCIKKWTKNSPPNQQTNNKKNPNHNKTKKPQNPKTIDHNWNYIFPKLKFSAQRTDNFLCEKY